MTCRRSRTGWRVTSVMETVGQKPRCCGKEIGKVDKSRRQRRSQGPRTGLVTMTAPTRAFRTGRLRFTTVLLNETVATASPPRRGRDESSRRGAETQRKGIRAIEGSYAANVAGVEAVPAQVTRSVNASASPCLCEILHHSSTAARVGRRLAFGETGAGLVFRKAPDAREAGAVPEAGQESFPIRDA